MPASRTTLALAASAAALAATALQVRAYAKRAEREHPPRGRFVRARGIKLHYLEAGGGQHPPIVFVDGNAVTAEDWVASGVFDRLVVKA